MSRFPLCQYRCVLFECAVVYMCACVAFAVSLLVCNRLLRVSDLIVVVTVLLFFVFGVSL